MPIQFQCHHCHKGLSITRRKAGLEIDCPLCSQSTLVPTLEEAAASGGLIESPASKQPKTEAAPDDRTIDDAETADSDRVLRVGEELDPLTPESESLATTDDTDATAEDFFGAYDQSPPGEPLNELFDDADTDEDEPDTDDPALQAAATRPSDGELASKDGTPVHLLWSMDDDEEDDDFSLGRSGIQEDELDMTPMVDVTFLLLIFFMITASFSVQKSMETQAPEPDEDGAAAVQTLEDFEDNSVIVEIGSDDEIRIDDTPADISELVDILSNKITNERKTEVLIEADFAATHGAVVAVTDAGIEVGMQRIRRVSQRRSD